MRDAGIFFSKSAECGEKCGEFQKLNSIAFKGEKVYNDNFRYRIREKYIQNLIEKKIQVNIFPTYTFKGLTPKILDVSYHRRKERIKLLKLV